MNDMPSEQPTIVDHSIDNRINNAGLLSAALSEHARQQYLSAMGIQTWFDPVLAVERAGPEYSAENACSTDATPGSVKAEVAVFKCQQQGGGVAEGAVVGHVAESAGGSTGSSTSGDSTGENSSALTLQSMTDKPPVNSLRELSVCVEQCQLCELHVSRKQSVCGEGSLEAVLMIVTDAPVEDAIFSAENKLMLQQMLRAIDIDLSQVYLTSLVKCPTPERRSPQTTEMICCDEHLSAQIKLIQPKVILVSGERASQQLLVSQKSLADLRLRQYQHLGVPVYASYHAQELPGCAASKRKAWQDLLQIKKILNA
ncbi:hypothetical protein MNBD_GAMMA10-2102 [hydrothermal vent metagenome]|uniref:Uracil-DNA glycosylase-like domain-containing protein n=1 Tax=hydrothermal vent metagenome TaxID=652676 RepID=A0A3B0XKR6_9ZZZZ